jgi:hypothetical protein
MRLIGPGVVVGGAVHVIVDFLIAMPILAGLVKFEITD